MAANRLPFSTHYTSRTSPPSNEGKRTTRRSNLAWPQATVAMSSSSDQQPKHLTLADLASSPQFGQPVGRAGPGMDGTRSKRSPTGSRGGFRSMPSPSAGRWDEDLNYASDLLDTGSASRMNLDFEVQAEGSQGWMGMGRGDVPQGGSQSESKVRKKGEREGVVCMVILTHTKNKHIADGNYASREIFRS